ncbi:MAG: tetratricopeptide repeat protein [Candidatus Kariarchaeaceae archaeon]|jgi:tetratricopeptide (TPR) repeat protein
MGLSQLNYLYSKGKFRDALDHIEEIESHYQPTHPDFFEIKLIKARIFLEMGYYEEGEKMLNSLLDLGRKGGKLTRLDMVILLADILWRKGDWEQSFFLQEMGEYDLYKLGNDIDQLEKDRRYAELKRLRGIYSRYTGELDTAIEYFSHCLYAAEKTDDQRLLSKIYYLLGLVHKENGELARAMTFLMGSLDLRKQFHDEINAAETKYEIGQVREALGDYHGAYQDYKEVYKIGEREENIKLKAVSIAAMGIVNLKMGRSGMGLELATTGLEMKAELGDVFDLSWTLYNLLKILLQSDRDHLAPIFMDELEKLYVENSQHPLIVQHYRLISGYNLMYSDKTIDKAKAQQLFKEVMNKAVIHVELNIAAMIAYTEMLLDELSSIPDEEIIAELRSLFKKLNEIIEEQPSIPISIEINLLKTRLSVMQLEYQRGLALLTNIGKEIDDKKMKYLEHKMMRLHSDVIQRVEEISGIKDDEMGVIQMVEKSQVEEQVAKLLKDSNLLVDPEKPVPVFFMVARDEIPVIKVDLVDTPEIDDEILDKMMRSLSMILRTQLSDNEFIERVKYGDYVILTRSLQSFTCNLIIRGSVGQEMMKLMEHVMEGLITLGIFDDIEESTNQTTTDIKDLIIGMTQA